MVLLLMANSPTLAQSVNGPLYADCGTSVVYYGSAPGIPNPTFSWNIAYSSGGGTSSLGPTIAVNLPNARGLATIRLTVSWEELVTTVIPNPSGMGTTTITRREPRSSSVTYYTQIGFIPSVPSILSGSGVVCGNNSTGTYSTNSVPGATTFTWEVSPPYRIVHPITGALVSTYTGTQTSVNVRFPGSGSVSNGYIRVKANSGGNCPASSGYRTRKVEFGPQTGSMTGPSTMALTTVGRFTVSGSGLSNYSWSTPSGLSPLSGTTTNSMVAEGLSATSGYVTATYRTCGVTRSSSRYVR
ncbi:MAG TPA: hypothetical protein DCR93_06750, partial [Cytophagales bacterium]|nr:hypothetical protein [Cytophagales bacterium]